MAIKALQFIHAVARKQAAKQSGKGITSIVNRMQAEAKAGEIAETFRLSGIPLEKLDDFIKSEKDVLKYLNIIESSKPVTREVSKDLIKVPRKKGEVFDLTGKKIDTSKPIIGGKNVSETEAEIAARLTKQNKEAIERLRNKEGPIDWDEVDKIDPEDFAYGGLAGMLGERTGYKTGLKVYPKVDIRQTGETPNGLDVDVRDTTYGGTGIYQGNNWFGGAEGLTGNVKVDVQKDGNTLFKDTMSKEDTVNFIAGLGNIEGDKFQIKADKDLNNVSIIFKKTFAAGGIAGMLGEPTYADEDHRVPYKDGTKFNPKRRTILKGLGALAALPVVGKFFKFAKPLAKTSKVADLTSVPIGSAEGMPAWFKPLVNRVIKEGEEVSGELERVITHKTTLPGSKTDVYVTQDLNTGDVIADIGMGKHGWSDGHLGQPVRLEYKASEVIEPNLKTGKGGGKTKEEFTVEEAEFTGGHPENIKFEESTIEKFGDHGSNFDEVEKFATGKVKKVKPTKKKVQTEFEQGRAEVEAEDLAKEAAELDPDFASGGRVPLAGGKKVLEGLAWLANKISPGSTKIGQTSKTMSGKTELKQAIAGFQEREAAKKADPFSPDFDMRAEADLIAKTPFKLEELKRLFGNQIDDNIIREIAAMDSAKQLKAIEDVKLYLRNMKNLRQETTLREFDVTGKKGHATGGRVPMLFGGGIYKTIIKNLAKDKGVSPSFYLKVTNYKNLPSEVRNLMSKADFEKMKAGRLEMFENLVEMAKTRQRFQESVKAGKEGSPHAAPIFEHLEKSFKSPVPSGVTDKDILQGEFILKNLKTKDRKLNATGGRVSLSAGGIAGMLGE